jgi:DNA modification methylase
VAKKPNADWLNQLYYGDNLDVLRQDIKDESVDLIYLDPPFNSNRSYSVLFQEKSGNEAQAQIEAFDDTWKWSQESEAAYLDLIQGTAPNKVKDALEAMRRLLGDNDLLAYLVMMTQRLVELHRVLKATGSLYLHCDPTASHYLKIVLDAIFGPQNFRNEITWRRTSTVKGNTSQGARHFGRNTDILLFYTKSDEYTFNAIYTAYSEDYINTKFSNIEEGTGRRFQTVSMGGPGGAAKGNPSYEVLGVTRFWRFSRIEMDRLIAEGRVYQGKPGDVPRQKYYLDEGKGVELQALWADIDAINSQAAERLGYPTQKPLVLLGRILTASSNLGDVVLDPFCGCGTTVDAAEKLARRWIGIDITTLAVDLIDARLRHTYGESITNTFEILGIPRDMEGAEALFQRSPFEFERWCVMMIDGQPNEKQVGDRGIDGVIRFPIDARGTSAKCLVSVKGGAINPGYLRDLVGVVETERASMGVFVCLREPTRGIIEAANHSGFYTHPANGSRYPRVQIVSVQDILDGKRPNMPQTMLPYFQAERRHGKTVEKLF